jgi:hypothetical protein
MTGTWPKKRRRRKAISLTSTKGVGVCAFMRMEGKAWNENCRAVMKNEFWRLSSRRRHGIENAGISCHIRGHFGVG